MKKAVYLIGVIVVGLLFLTMYSTYAMFAIDVSSGSVINAEVNLSFNSGINEFKIINLSANAYKIVKVDFLNNTDSDLNYKMWYQTSGDISIGKLEGTTEELSGKILIGENREIYLLIFNNGSNDINVNVGVEFASNSIVFGNELTEITDTLSLATDLSGIETSFAYDYTGDYETFVAPIDGDYKIELWGGSGGDISSYNGGNGAYTAGIINLAKNDIIYVYVGGAGVSSTGGYNGGGSITSSESSFGTSGGGASDIRLVSGNYNDEQSLRSRIMVAAGGGGANYRGSGYGEGNGGAGGTILGVDGQTTNHTSSYGYGYGQGGSQIAGGKSIWVSGTNTYTGVDGIFGHGGGLELSSIVVQSGGGSGYYGGASSAHGGAGGGSSYISGYLGCVAIASADSTTPRENCTSNTTDINCSYHYSGKIFSDSVMLAGTESMPGPSGNSTIIGNDGNGYAKIYLYAPYLEGLTDKNISSGASVDLTEDVSCVDNGTGCEIVDVNISDTSVLEVGTYQVKYTVKDQNNKRFIFSRTLVVANSQTQWRYGYSSCSAYKCCGTKEVFADSICSDSYVSGYSCRSSSCSYTDSTGKHYGTVYCELYESESYCNYNQSSCSSGETATCTSTGINYYDWSITDRTGQQYCQKRTCSLDSNGDFTICSDPTSC